MIFAFVYRPLLSHKGNKSIFVSS